MNIWREVGRRLVVWLVMVTATVGGIVLFAAPLELAQRAEFVNFLWQALLIGALTVVSLSYFTARLNDEKVTRALVAGWLLGISVFPEYVWDPLSRVFGGVNPVTSVLLSMLIVSLALNVGLAVVDRRAHAVGRGKAP